eukprot:16447014-Heterocapsa_arctica.AAC.1
MVLCGSTLLHTFLHFSTLFYTGAGRKFEHPKASEPARQTDGWGGHPFSQDVLLMCQTPRLGILWSGYPRAGFVDERHPS